jgi:hypothetical protein
MIIKHENARQKTSFISSEYFFMHSFYVSWKFMKENNFSSFLLSRKVEEIMKGMKKEQSQEGKLMNGDFLFV